jgi:broad specificity phosphatase PhoE
MAAVPRVLLVRHGRAAASFGEDRDPPLSEIGHAQAEAMALSVAPLGPLTVVTSPLRRTRETAAPVERLWGVEARVEPAVAEVPSPPGTTGEPGPATALSSGPSGGPAGPTSLAWRGPWLSDLLARRWDEVDPFVVEWRNRVLAALSALDADTVVTTHFVAINVAVGRATGDPRVACCQPDYCSRTAIAIEAGRWSLLELGAQAASAVG